MLKNWLAVLLLFLSLAVHAQVVVKGRVVNQKESPVYNVRIEEQSTRNFTVSNANGEFTLFVVSPDNPLLFSRDGFDTLKLKVEPNKYTVIFLTPEGGSNQYNMGFDAGYLDFKNKLPNKNLENMPYFGGEADINRVLQMLPGVEHGSEGFSNLYVRGGDVDQNLMLYNGTPVYNYNHLFGISSTFHHKSIDKTGFYRGINPSSLGGRLSSVISLESKKNAEYSGVHGEFEMTPLNAGIYFESIKKDKSYFTLSARRSWIDLLLPIEVRENSFNANFYDVQLNFGFTTKKNDKIDVSFLNTRDNYMLAALTSDTVNSSLFKITRRWYNILGSVKHTKEVNSRLTARNSVHISHYHSLLGLSEQILANRVSLPDPYSELNQTRGIYDLMLWSDWDYEMDNTNHVNFGVQAINRLFLPSKITDLAQNFPGTPDYEELRGTTSYTASFEVSAYGENVRRLSDKDELIYGLRLTGYSYRGYLTGGIQPRIHYTKQLENNDVFKVAYNRQNQFVDQLNITDAGIADLIWVPITQNTGPQNANIIEAGYERKLGEIYSFSANAFFKTFGNISQVSNTGDITDEGEWDAAMVMGTGNAYGLELLLQKNEGDFTGWISYSFGRSTRNFPELFAEDFLFTQDRTHMIKLYANLITLDNWNYGINYLIGSGSLYTLPIGKFRDIAGNLQLEYNTLNNYRSPMYQRLDISVIRIRDIIGAEQQWKFYLYNALGNRNPLNINALFEDSSLTELQINRNYIAFIPGVAYIVRF
jgi:hypothetical protein